MDVRATIIKQQTETENGKGANIDDNKETENDKSSRKLNANLHHVVRGFRGKWEYPTHLYAAASRV